MMVRLPGIMAVRCTTVFILNGEVLMASDPIRKMFLRQGGSQTLKRQEQRQKAREPSAGEAPLP